MRNILILFLVLVAKYSFANCAGMLPSHLMCSYTVCENVWDEVIDVRVDYTFNSLNEKSTAQQDDSCEVMNPPHEQYGPFNESNSVCNNSEIIKSYTTDDGIFSFHFYQKGGSWHAYGSGALPRGVLNEDTVCSEGVAVPHETQSCH